MTFTNLMHDFLVFWFPWFYDRETRLRKKLRALNKRRARLAWKARELAGMAKGLEAEIFFLQED